MTKRIGDLEIHTDMRFHERMWRAERVGWGVMILLIVAALAGVFGAGPVSQSTASEGGGRLLIEYERFIRYRAPGMLRVHFEVPAGAREARVGLDQSFLEAIQIERITPEPDAVEQQARRVFYVFRVQAPLQRAFFTLHFRPQSIGSLSPAVTLADGGAVSLWQFVYP